MLCDPRELSDSGTVYRCHFVVGCLLHREHHNTQARDSFQAALAAARQLRDRHKEVEALKELAQVGYVRTYH